jgi:hypothetical protein
MTSDNTKDISLTVADVEDLDPSEVVRLHDTVRAAAEEYRQRAGTLADALAGERDALARMTALAQHYERQARERDSRLAMVAMLMVDQGALQLMGMQKKEPADE